MKFTGMTIGVPREIMGDERRVAAIPETVRKLVLSGAKVIVEKGAGEGAFFSDDKYIEAGAEMVEKPDEVYSRATTVIKVKHPQFNEALGIHEADMLHEGQILACFLHPENPDNYDMARRLVKNGVSVLMLESVPRISRAQNMDALTTMSTVAGYKSVLIAAERLTKFLPMMGTAVGMIRPSSVLVVGAGVAGLQAIATAKRLGAVVNCVEIRKDGIDQAKMLGAKVVNLGLDPNEMLDEKGFPLVLNAELLDRERQALKPLVKSSDILILTPRVRGHEAPKLITEEMVKSMEDGSVIIDVAIDSGGCCEMTVPGEIVTRYGVSIDGTRNIPGMMPTSSTFMFAHNVYYLLEYMASEGKMIFDLQDTITSSVLCIHEGKVLQASTKIALGY